MPSRTSMLYRRLGGASRPSCRSQCSRSQALRFGNLHACRRVAEGLAARRRSPRSGGHGQNRTGYRTALQRHSSAWDCRALGTPAGTTMAGVDVFVETDRLVLRRFTRGDLELLVELDSDPGVKRLIDKAFAELGVDRVYASTMMVNTASRRVMEKAGLRYVRTFHADWPVKIPGDEEGDVEYAIERAQWENDRAAG